MALDDATREQMALLMEELLEKDNEKTLRLIKELKPEMNIPQIEIKDQLAAKAKEADEKYAGLETKLGNIEKTLNVIVTRGGLEKRGRTEDEIKAIEELITSKEVNNYKTAEELYDSRQGRLAASTQSGPLNRRQKLGTDLSEDKLKQLREDPINFARNEAIEALHDIRNGRVKIGPGGMPG